jgi:iron(III) transport system substrate-binding protein
MKQKSMGRVLAGIALAAAFSAPAFAQTNEINVYSQRQNYLIQPILDTFSKETGIRVNVIFAQNGLVERMAAEGANSPADLLLTADIGFLTSAIDAGVTQPIKSDVVAKNIPANYRDPSGQWVGLTSRARVVYASKERVKQDSITYEELADPKWKGKICIRSGQHAYNLALIASIIAHDGEAKAKEWLKGVKANLAAKPAGGDREQAKAIFSGQCDIALGNTYYMALMASEEKQPEQKQWAAAVKVLFPNATGRGTHTNISGVVLAKHAPNKANAIKLVEFLTGDEAQKLYAELNNEYPLRKGVPLSPVVQSWGTLHPDPVSLADIGKYRKRASELVDEVGFDQGPSS